jgi:hypothetical protein
VAAFFSVTGMVEVFPGAPVAVMAFAGTMEAAKLIVAGWLAAHWPVAGWKLRTVMVALVTGLALINAAGRVRQAGRGARCVGCDGAIRRLRAVVDARLTSQSATVADLDHRLSQIDGAVEEAIRRGRMAGAMNLAERQRSTRDGLVAARQAATATLIDMQTQRAALTAETARVEAAMGPVQYLAVMVGTDSEVVRWLILLMVLCCDPAAIALTIAVAGARHLSAPAAGRSFGFKKLLIDNDGYVRRSWSAHRRVVRKIYERLSAFLVCCVIALLLVFHERAASFVVGIFGCRILFWLTGAAGEHKTPNKNSCESHVGLKSANRTIAHGNGEQESPSSREHIRPKQS